MTNSPNQPKKYDAVLGDQTPAPADGIVLGGLQSIKRLYSSILIEQRITAVSQALKYGQEGVDLLIQALNDESQQVQQVAFHFLHQNSTEQKVKQALLDFRYQPLRNLLAAEKWQEADQETTAVMLKVCAQEQEGCLSLQDIEQFPCEDLRMIDSLWVTYSQRRFGFSVQTKIWQSIGGTADPDWEAWCRFGSRIGWYIKDSWLWWNDLTFTLKAPIGHLPRGGAFIGWGLADFWTGCKMFSSLGARLENCKIL